MFVLKDDVQFEIERLQDLFNELVECAKGERPKLQLEHGLPDEWELTIKNNKYPIGQIAEVDANKLEACMTRVNNEMKNLLKAMKKKL